MGFLAVLISLILSVAELVYRFSLQLHLPIASRIEAYIEARFITRCKGLAWISTHLQIPSLRRLLVMVHFT